MKKFTNNNNGFTITEILVSISLGILLTGLLIGFYLFVLKISIKTTPNISSSQKINKFISILDTKLINSDDFSITESDDFTLLTLESGQKIYFYNNFILSNRDTILTGLDSIYLTIEFKNQFELSELEHKKLITSDEVKKINLFVNKDFVFNFYVPKFNIKGSKNVKKIINQ